MSDPRTTLTRPVHVGLPNEAPEPVSGCDVCAALAKQRAEAEEARNWSHVTDCNVEIRRHPEGH